MQEFTDKVAVVTGAASGIGRGIARHCAREGMRIVLADVDESGLTELARSLEADGAKVHVRPTDVREAANVEALASDSLAAFGAVHLVFNNAGVMLGGYSWERTEDDWRWVLDVNVFGVVNGLRVFMPILLDQGEPAHMVNTASIGGLMVGPFLSPYIVSKHAVVALTEAAYLELATLDRPVGISALCPGPIATGIVDSERLRPEDRTNTKPLASPAERTFDQLVKSGVSAGMAPDEVGAIVFQGIRDGRFWIFTHEMHAEAVRARAENIASGENPVYDDGLMSIMEDAQ